MVKTSVEPDCLIWARERASLSPSDLAKRIGVKEEKVTEWEETGNLTLSQAERLANATHIPLGYLFLPKPPSIKLPIDDFRTIDASGVSDPSPELLDTLNDAILKQDWYRDYLLENAADRLDFIGTVTINDNPAEAAERIRAVVKWTPDLRGLSRTLEEAFKAYTQRVEQVGILVMRNSVVGNNNHRPLSVNEFRGFALADAYAPLIFINSRDTIAARLFTLAHELVHIWIGRSGVSNENLIQSGERDVERFCNKVAAELLVPTSELESEWRRITGSRNVLELLVRHFKVSSLVILRRLLDTGKIANELFIRLYHNEMAQFNRKAENTTGGGGNFYATIRSRWGTPFVSALVSSTLEGKTMFRDAFRLLGVNNADGIKKLASLTLGGTT